jgi:hypothetical protein
VDDDEELECMEMVLAGDDEGEEVLEVLHARQLAKETSAMVKEEGREQSLQRYWVKIGRKQGGFQGLCCVLESLRQEEGADESYACSGL